MLETLGVVNVVGRYKPRANATKLLLNALAVLDQPRVPEGEEHAALRQELFRLEAKLDLVTSLAARLLARYEQALREVQAEISYEQFFTTRLAP